MKAWKTVAKAAAVAAAGLLAAGAAHAGGAKGDTTVEAGWMRIAPTSSSGLLTIDSAMGFPVNQAVPDTGAKVGVSNTLGLEAKHYFTDNVAVGLFLGVPPKFDLNGTKSLGALGKLGEARQWTPAVIAEWHFLEPSSKLRPYLGAGVSYTWFTGERLTNSTFSGAAFPGATNVKVSASGSWNPLVKAGVTYDINENWFVNAAVAYMPLKTKVSITAEGGPAGPVVSHADVRVNPWISFVSVGYKF